MLVAKLSLAASLASSSAFAASFSSYADWASLIFCSAKLKSAK